MSRESHEGQPELDADNPLTLPGFFDALAEGELLGGICADCGEVLLPPRPACYNCGSRSIDVESRPRIGYIYTYTEVHTPPPALEDDAPYTIAIVELESGGRLTGRVESPYEVVEIGDRVELRVRAPTEGERLLALEHESGWPIHVFERIE
ncbi:MAG: Zn-ribbon domain-containing OB-fold protein [Halobacteriota archaeon]|uniref:Zn-ribbon domain-containing OB-fold protein n=1 Tax=Natronomonas sp. TaxID=2184060 RepID=UPI0039757007